METRIKAVAIYHKDCTDGTAAAAVVLRKYPGALLFPLSHGYEEHEFAPVLESIKEGDLIFTVDCAIGADKLLEKGFSVTVIDHHVGIKDEIENLASKDKRMKYVFDNQKSGSSLAWSYFFPDEELPEVIRLIEDQDLWRWRYGADTKNVNNVLSEFVNKPEEMLAMFDRPLDEVKRDGAIISRFNDLLIDHAVKTTEPLDLEIGGHKVPFYNITFFKSESANILSKLRGSVVGLYSIDGEKVKVSFRSCDGQSPSALDIAKLLGGGGHKNSSGAGMLLEEFIKSIDR